MIGTAAAAAAVHFSWFSISFQFSDQFTANRRIVCVCGFPQRTIIKRKYFMRRALSVQRCSLTHIFSIFVPRYFRFTTEPNVFMCVYKSVSLTYRLKLRGKIHLYFSLWTWTTICCDIPTESHQTTTCSNFHALPNICVTLQNYSFGYLSIWTVQH